METQKQIHVLDQTGTGAIKPRNSNEWVWIAERSWFQRLRDKFPLFSFFKLGGSKNGE